MFNGLDPARPAGAESPLPFAEAREVERKMLAATAARGFGSDWFVWSTEQSLVVPARVRTGRSFPAPHVTWLQVDGRFLFATPVVT